MTVVQLDRCGSSFSISAAPRTPWKLFALLLASVIVGFAALTTLWVLPFFFWVFVIMRLAQGSPSSSSTFVTIAPAHVESRQGRIELLYVARVTAKYGSIELVGRGRRTMIDMPWLSVEELQTVARHIEARALLSHAEARDPAESAALEAFHVFGVSAVRVRQNEVVEILEGDGPWTVPTDECVYVKRLLETHDGYRSNARVIELGELA